eukprot:1089999-Heterocapsa_arctica.AAC.1
MEGDVSETDRSLELQGVQPSDMDRSEETNRRFMDKESTESNGEMACEDIVWNIQMVVHADEIGHMTCTPTELIECKSGKGWWRVCKETLLQMQDHQQGRAEAGNPYSERGDHIYDGKDKAGRC